HGVLLAAAELDEEADARPVAVLEARRIDREPPRRPLLQGGERLPPDGAGRRGVEASFKLEDQPLRFIPDLKTDAFRRHRMTLPHVPFLYRQASAFPDADVIKRGY